MIVKYLDQSYRPCLGHPGLVAFLTDGKPLSSESRLVGGEHYVVAALALGPVVPWYFLLDRQPGSRVPIPAPCLMFEVVDSIASPKWEVSAWIDRLGERHSLLAPPMWARDELFHGRLFEGDSAALEQMDSMAAELLVERPLPWITKRTLTVGSDNWVTDDDWGESWVADPQQAMTMHPKSGELWHNPLFVDASHV